MGPMTPIETVRTALERAADKHNVRVTWTVRSGSFSSHTYRGVVTQVTPASVVVVEDRNKGVHRFRARRGAHVQGMVDLQILTPHQLALEAWANEMPSTKFITVVAQRLGGRVDWGDDLTLAVTQCGKLPPIGYLTDLVIDGAKIEAWLGRRPVGG